MALRSILTMLLAALAAMACAPATAQHVYAITNVTVVPMDRERLLPSQTVIVRDGRIAAIGDARSVDVPAGATRIDGSGRFLMPGLAEMHAHVPSNPADTQWSADVLYLYVANGVTYARSMLGAPHHIELRARAERGEIVAPRIYASGPSFNGNSVATPADGARMVREQKAAGYDGLKIHPGLDRARYDAVAATAREIGIPFGGHVPEAVGLARALEVGQATVDHLDGYTELLVGDALQPPGQAGFFGVALTGRVDEKRIAAVARRTREAGVWNVPTEALIRHVLPPEPSAAEIEARPEMRYIPRAMLAQWRQARVGFQSGAYDPAQATAYAKLRSRLIKALHDEGAGLLLGSDAPQFFNVPGFSIHRELTYLVEAGLTPYQALATGTVNVARFLGKEAEFGTVQPGRRADLILLEANPLADVGNAARRAGVMLNGRWFPEAELQRELAAIATRAGS